MTRARGGPGSEGRPALRLIRPLQDFLAAEVASGALLVAAAAVGLAWANSPWQTSYERLWETVFVVGLGGHLLALDLRHWVNEGLMTVFFFVAGLEIKRELAEGELRDRRKAALPAVAAVGGMAVPALLYLAVNRGGQAARGWGVPMATDIALALGVAALLGRWVPQPLRLFLLTLAIVDDIGAIAVIAVCYSQVAWPGLAAACALVLCVVVFRAVGVIWTGAYVAVGVVLWLAFYQAGVHATMAGVVLGLLTPTQPLRRAEFVEAERLADITTTEAALETVTLARQSVSVVEWLEHALHRWAGFVVVPLFAMANAGVPVGARALGGALRSPVTLGVVLGLVVGKTVGVSLFAWLACRSGVGALPAGVSWRQVVGIATLAGIGLTVSIFVTGLAFDDPVLRDQATVGVLVASLVAAALGALILYRAPSPAPRQERSTDKSSRG